MITRTKWVFKVVAVFVLSLTVYWGIGALPDSIVQIIAGYFAPRGEITLAFVPVFKFAIQIVLTILVAIVTVCHFLKGYLRFIILYCWQEAKAECHVIRIRLCNSLLSMRAFEWSLFFLILGVTCGIRLFYLNLPMRFDEAMTINLYVPTKWLISLANYSMPNNHLLNTILIKPFYYLWHGAEWAVRLPAFFAGVCCICVVYTFGRAFYNRYVALLAMALVSVNGVFIYMSVNARGYSLVALCGLLSFMFMYLIIEKKYIIGVIGYAVCCGVGLITVPVALSFVVAGYLWGICYLFVRYPSWRERLKCVQLLIWASCLIGVIAILGYMPMFLVVGTKGLFSNEWVTPLAMKEFIIQFPAHIGDYLVVSFFSYPMAITVILVFGAVWYLFHYRSIKKYSGMPILVFAILACMLILCVNRRYPFIGLSPMWMFLTACILVCISAGTISFLQKFRKYAFPRILCGGVLVVLLVGAVGIFSHDPSTEASPLWDQEVAARDVMEILKEQLGNEERILADHAMGVYQYYTYRLGLTETLWDGQIEHAETVYLLKRTPPVEKYVEYVNRTLKHAGLLEHEFQLISTVHNVQILRYCRPSQKM